MPDCLTQLEDRLLILKDKADSIQKAFDPNQPRDAEGQWSSSGGGAREVLSDFRFNLHEINHALREGKPVLITSNPTEWNKPYDPPKAFDIRAFDEFMDKNRLAQDLTVLRGFAGDFARTLSAMPVGSIFEDKGYSFTTDDLGVLEEFDPKDTFAEILLPVGSSVVLSSKFPGLGDDDDSMAQGEYVLPRGSRFRKDGVRDFDLPLNSYFGKPKKLITLTLLPPSAKVLTKLEDRFLILKDRVDSLQKAFDPNQPRADDGKWSSGGGVDLSSSDWTPAKAQRLDELEVQQKRIRQDVAAGRLTGAQAITEQAKITEQGYWKLRNQRYLESIGANKLHGASALTGEFPHHPDYIYHGTSSVKSEAVEAGGFPSGTYLATHPRLALDEAAQASHGESEVLSSRRVSGGEPVVYAIDRKAIRGHQFKIDYEYEDPSGTEANNVGRAVIVQGSIPSGAVRRLSGADIRRHEQELRGNSAPPKWQQRVYKVEDRFLVLKDRVDSLQKAFDPNQPRDDGGRWTGSSGWERGAQGRGHDPKAFREAVKAGLDEDDSGPMQRLMSAEVKSHGVRVGITKKKLAGIMPIVDEYSGGLLEHADESLDLKEFDKHPVEEHRIDQLLTYQTSVFQDHLDYQQQYVREHGGLPVDDKYRYGHTLRGMRVKVMGGDKDAVVLMDGTHRVVAAYKEGHRTVRMRVHDARKKDKT